MSTVTEPQPDEVVSANPIFTALILREEPGGYLRGLFGLGLRDGWYVEPDVVHDPEPARVITRARVISATPTGSLMLDMGPGRSVVLTPDLARHYETSYLQTPDPILTRQSGGR